MILVFVLIGAVLVLSLLLAQRLRLSLAWGPDGPSVRLRYLMIHWRSGKRSPSDPDSMSPGGAAAGKKERRKARKRRRAPGRKRWRVSWRRLIALFPEAASAVWKSGGFLVRRCRIEHLRIEGPIGTSDPAVTGMLWGAVSAAQEGILATGVGRSRLWPDFGEGRTQITVDATLSVAAGSLLATPLLLVWHLPKRELWRAVRWERLRRTGEGPTSTG